MPKFSRNRVKLEGGTVLWDSVTQPEQTPQGRQKYALKVAFPPNHPDVPLFNQLATEMLNASHWRGQLPAGARMPITTATAHELGGKFEGWSIINFKTMRLPDVYDSNVEQIDSLQLPQVLYSGQKVDILGHTYLYDSAGNKGISAGLDAIKIHTDQNIPRQSFGGSVNTQEAFL